MEIKLQCCQDYVVVDLHVRVTAKSVDTKL